MTLAAGSSQPHRTIDDLIREWAAYQLIHVRTAPSTVAMRAGVLTRVYNALGEDGLFVTDPTAVSLSFYGGRVQSHRRTRVARNIACAIEDFREWHTIQMHRGI